ncbi:hypothetical protein PIB30_033160 [Stylosanthes scabra]|uniref:Uncharacterized protein n=1 Tax=Stylosanthes scabra TaxID=79078 RepID=A0ABU6YD28_9FABA|nr:hypothetical protein [Stylosanthes scabra]
MRESWWRIDRRAGPNQFFRRSHQLSVAITFDPELRLTHGLRLREALDVLFTIITHAKHGLKWRIEHENRDLLCLDTRWREGNRVLALSLASRPVGRDDEMNGIEMDGFKEKGLRMNLMAENGFK